jgi:hypothetical protein
MLTTASSLRENFGLAYGFVYKKKEKAPDQNRTDTSSLEGYGSTIELQALNFTTKVVTEKQYFSKKFFL